MSKELLEAIDQQNLPKHVAIILDGNGRWAQKRKMPRSYGHKAGMERVVDIVEVADDLGIGTFTVYAFSTENWKRPAEEVRYLMGLVVYYMKTQIDRLMKNNVKLCVLGDLDDLPERAAKALFEGMERTSSNSGMVFNIAINYGGRNEILRAFRRIHDGLIQGTLQESEIDEATISENLYTAESPDPDLVIRPGGELRISNFLIYQAAYAELVFSDVLWPDFDASELYKAVLEYQRRNRRYGGI